MCRRLLAVSTLTGSRSVQRQCAERKHVRLGVGGSIQLADAGEAEVADVGREGSGAGHDANLDLRKESVWYRYGAVPTRDREKEQGHRSR
jgi:hypothetical protein